MNEQEQQMKQLKALTQFLSGATIIEASDKTGLSVVDIETIVRSNFQTALVTIDALRPKSEPN